MLLSTNDTEKHGNLNDDLSLNKAKMCYQKKEIEWTLSMITKFQANIYKHQEALNNLMQDKTALMEEKSYLKSLQEDYYGDGDASDVDESLSPLHSDVINNDKQLALFSEIYQILKSPKSPEFYKLIIDHLSEFAPCKEIFFQNQTLIPNDLKASTAPRKMILHRIDTVGEYPLEDIVRQPITMSIDLHISTGSGEILSLRGDEPHTQYHITTITSRTSFFILKCQTTLTRFVLLVNTAPMILAVEINNRIDCSVESSSRLPDPIGYIREPPKSASFDLQLSYIRRDLPLKDIRSRLLFIDISCAESVHGKMVPIALTVLDYQSNVLINTLLCPRVQIGNYRHDLHGYGEKDVIGKADSQDILNNFYSLIWDRIIVGYELREKLDNLKVDMRSLCGVRELQGSVALGRMMNSVAKSWSLAEVSQRVLNHQFQEAVYSAEYNAHVIWRIYIALEAHWQDSQGSACAPFIPVPMEMSLLTPSANMTAVTGLERVATKRRKRYNQP